MYFSSTATSVVCLISTKSWEWTAGNAEAKRQAIEGAVAYQSSLLGKLAHITSRNFFTVSDLSAAFDKLTS